MTEADWSNYLALWAPEMTYQDRKTPYTVKFSDGYLFAGSFYSPLDAVNEAKYDHHRSKPVAVHVLRTVEDQPMWVQLEGVL